MPELRGCAAARMAAQPKNTGKRNGLKLRHFKVSKPIFYAACMGYYLYMMFAEVRKL